MIKFKKRLIKIGIIALMPILALLLCLNNTYAYYLGSDNNVYSNNLLPNSSDFTLVGSDYVFNVDLSTSYYYTFKVYGDNNSGAFAMWTEDENGNTLETLTRGSSVNDTFVFSPHYNAVKLGIYANNINNSNLMLNIGQNALAYEPYGVWINDDLYNSVVGMTSLSYFLNGGKIKLIDVDGYELVSETISISSNATSISLNDFSTIQSYMNDHSSLLFDIVIDFNAEINSNFYMWVSNAYRDNLVLYLDNSQHWIRQSMFNPNENNEFLVVGNSIMYDKIKISLCEGYTNFTLNLSVDNFYFKDGYKEGYKDGSIEGYSNGYNVGVTDGFNNGYNEGSIQNIETNGMKTLFNSILSYPVNMIRSVFNFEFMGINIASVIMFIVSIGIVIFVVKKFKE